MTLPGEVWTLGSGQGFWDLLSLALTLDMSLHLSEPSRFSPVTWATHRAPPMEVRFNEVNTGSTGWLPRQSPGLMGAVTPVGKDLRRFPCCVPPGTRWPVAGARASWGGGDCLNVGSNGPAFRSWPCGHQASPAPSLTSVSTSQTQLQ